MNFSIVIPTYNRENDLKKCLDSILGQTFLPTEVIIIDDGELSQELLGLFIDNFKKQQINIVYSKKNHEVERRGSSESRNKSLELINNDVFFIFDDDVILELSFCEYIMNVWEEKEGDNNLVGVGGIIKNRRKRVVFEKFYYAFFGIHSKFGWDVNPVGFQIWDEEIKEKCVGYYIHGGVCSYNLSLVRELKFSTFSGGRTALEDVDFCLRAKNKGYYFMVEPRAELNHYPSSSSREGQFLIGYKESYNRRVIFRSINKKPSIYLLTWFYWTNFGWILRQFLVGNFSKGLGLIKGILAS